jgi:hypothetical protein
MEWDTQRHEYQKAKKIRAVSLLTTVLPLAPSEPHSFHMKGMQLSVSGVQNVFSYSINSKFRIFLSISNIVVNKPLPPPGITAC